MCESMLKTLAAEYERSQAGKKGSRAARVIRVRIVMGQIHQIVTESFLLAWEALTPGTAFEGAALELKKIPLAVHCRTCGWEGEIEAPFFLCGRCGRGAVETISGNELYIEDMEIADDEPEGI
ncbi:MAG: hydrogenase maturation nickel metallochaperone HypA [Spirochaetales bacterium]|nr:hydrogenase maturation nickel metallochaperone HypA [Spirochaetales bacterium]